VQPGKLDGIRYCGDAVAATAHETDKCGGMAGRDGVYKYHTTPVCLQQQLAAEGNMHDNNTYNNTIRTMMFLTYIF
jgi:hypothetical protein